MSQVPHKQRAHALLSASSSSRWLNCTPSARLEDEIAETNTSDFAGEGTLAHEIAELLLRNELGMISPEEANAQTEKLQSNKYFYSEMLEELEQYTSKVIEEYNASKALTPDAVISIEDKIVFADYVPEGFGSNDCVIIDDNYLKVIDLKFGKGVRVSAVNNSQLMLYGLGAYLKYGFMYGVKALKLIIVQPRLDAISEHEISVEALLYWAETTLKPKAEKAYKGEGEQVVGPWCQFCKVQYKCKAMEAERLKVLALDFADPNTLSDEELLEVYKTSSLVMSFLKAVDAHILKTALQGKTWEGLKVVEGRSVRKLSDEQAVAAKLNELGYTDADIYNKKIKGIGDLERLVGKKEFNDKLGDLIVKPAGAPTIAPESDKRPAYNSAEADFADDFNDN